MSDLKISYKNQVTYLLTQKWQVHDLAKSTNLHPNHCFVIKLLEKMVRLQHKTSVNQEELQKIGKKHALKNRTNFIIVYIYFTGCF